MKVILKTYKYRMYPNKAQEQMLARYFGSVRFVLITSLLKENSNTLRMVKAITTIHKQAHLLN